MQKRRACLLAISSLLSGFAFQAQAQDAALLLKTPLKIVVGFPPGGSADVLARVLAQHLTGIAPTVIVDNKPGAGGRLALDTLKASAADGSALVITPSSMLTVFPHIYNKLSYNPLTDFQPVARVAAAPFILAVGPMVPKEVTTLKDFVQWGKANPERASYGSSGSGSMPHFTGVALGKSFNMDWTHVAYRGAAPAMTDLIGGQVAANVSVTTNAMPHIRSGKLRALATSGNQRTSTLPDVPTFAELGAPSATAVEWFGVFAPAQTSAEVIQRLNQAINQATQSPAFRQALEKGSYEAVSADKPEAVSALLKKDLNHWQQVVKASGFTPED